RCRLAETFIDGGQQRMRRERLAQAACGAEFEGHFEKIRRGYRGIRKCIAGHRNQRNRRRTFVEYPNGLETTHMRHENIDEHQVERRCFKRMNPRFTAVSDGDFEALAFKTELNSLANHWVVIDQENTRHA